MTLPSKLTGAAGWSMEKLPTIQVCPTWFSSRGALGSVQMCEQNTVSLCVDGHTLLWRWWNTMVSSESASRMVADSTVFSHSNLVSYSKK